MEEEDIFEGANKKFGTQNNLVAEQKFGPKNNWEAKLIIILHKANDWQKLKSAILGKIRMLVVQLSTAFT